MDQSVSTSRHVICARCGADFGCDLDGDCWCRNVPLRLPMPAAGEDCLCPDCLQAAAVAHNVSRPRD